MLTSKTNKIYSDVVQLIAKYSGLESSSNITTYSKDKSEEGFYLIFIKKNNKETKDKKIQITEFASGININDLLSVFGNIIESHQKLSKTINYNA